MNHNEIIPIKIKQLLLSLHRYKYTLNIEMANSFEMIAKTFQGLEEVLAKELEELGASQIEIIRRGVRFFGDKEMLYKANFCCRTALRILKCNHILHIIHTDIMFLSCLKFVSVLLKLNSES